MVDALFDPDDPTVSSIKEVYQDLTGDRRVTGRLAECDQARLREAIQIGTGTGAGVLAEIFGDSISRRMIAMYRNSTIYMWWQRVVDVTSVPDFRTQHRMRLGGYMDLPSVAQGADYTALTSPTDEEETFSATKRGGLESITLEAIKNDDMGVIGRIPVKLARAAARTVSQHVSDVFTANSGGGATMGDGQTIFYSGHHNRGTAALSRAAVAAGRLAILQQTEVDGHEQVGVEPRLLLVPWELQETAWDLFRRGAENDAHFVAHLGYNVIPVPHWTDATDWVLATDPVDVPVIELGFLDGRREPELFLQNMETVGSLFDSDQWKYKIRHIYGSTPLDYRGLYKGVVAG